MLQISFKVNGRDCRVEVNPFDTLAKVLREKLGFVDVKTACENGECGSCTVIMDGKAIVSCLMLAAKADGKEITTAEGWPKTDSFIPCSGNLSNTRPFSAATAHRAC